MSLEAPAYTELISATDSLEELLRASARLEYQGEEVRNVGYRGGVPIIGAAGRDWRDGIGSSGPSPQSSARVSRKSIQIDYRTQESTTPLNGVYLVTGTRISTIEIPFEKVRSILVCRKNHDSPKSHDYTGIESEYAWIGLRCAELPNLHTMRNYRCEFTFYVHSIAEETEALWALDALCFKGRN